MRMSRPAFIAKVHEEGIKLFKTHGRRQTTTILLEKYKLANPARATFDRWIFLWSSGKIADLQNLARQKNGKIRLPSNLKKMEDSRTRRPDLESDVYVKYRYRRDVSKLKINLK